MIDGIARSLHENDKPLCPNSTNPPIAEAHALRVRMLDAFYNTAAKDEDGDIATEDTGKAYHAAAYGPTTGDRMDLFHASSGVDLGGGHFATVGAWWYRCGICGLNLPAQVERTWP